MSYFNGHKIPNITSRGDSAFIRYSAHPDGTDFTETWREGQIYIGFATGQTAPKEKEAYTWAFLTGEKGADGLTPHIGANGNWWIGDEDTGVKAQGDNGKDGESGKSAYEVAVELGFEGTEEEWLESLTADIEKKAAQAIENAEESIEYLEYVAGNAQNRIDDALFEALDRIENEVDGVFDIVQSTGDSVTRVMSQKATTEALNQRANTLKGKSSGAIVALDDVSPLEHKVGVKLSSKNLLTYPFVNTTRTHSGITFTDNGDGTITANGTCTPAEGVPYAEFAVYKGSGEAVYGRLILSGCPSGGSASTYHIIDSPTGQRDIGDGKVYQHYLNRADIRIRIYPGVTVENLVFKPMLIMSETGAVEPFTPYVADDTEVTLTVCDKSLIPYPYTHTTKTMNGVTFTDNGDGSITINGTATATSSFTLNSGSLKLSAGEYVISGYVENVEIVAVKNGNSWLKNNSGTFNEGDTFSTITIYIQSGKTLDNVTIYPRLEKGTTPSEYARVTTTLAEGAELTSIAPNMTILTDNAGVVIEAEYNRDSNIVIEKLTQAIISLGGNI